MVAKHTKVPAHVIETDYPWTRFVVHLATSIELEEQESFRFWVLAGQDPKKFRWHARRRREPLSGDQLGKKVIQFAAERFGVHPRKSDVWNVAQAKGLKPFYRVEDEKGVRYIDETGQEITPPKGQIFIPSRHREAEKLAQRVRNGEA